VKLVNEMKSVDDQQRRQILWDNAARLLKLGSVATVTKDPESGDTLSGRGIAQ